MIVTWPQMDVKQRFQLFPPLGVCLFLVVATLAAYWPVIHSDFINLDDPDYFMANAHVLTGLKPANIAWAFTTGFASNWHPLTWLSLMLDAQLFGNGPFGPHFVNLLLHAANAILLFFLLRSLTAATWKSAFVASLFALHPLHVESVAWVAERKDVLSAFFGFISIWAYARYARERPSPARSRVLTLNYSAALFFFALGLMSKPMLVTLPCILLLLDYWPLQRFKIPDVESALQKLILEKIPFLILSLLSSIATFVAQQKGGAVASLTYFPVSERIENTFVSYARYLGKTFWPFRLANPYPYPDDWPGPLVVFSIIVFILLCVTAVLLLQKFPFGFVGWFWFAGMLVPTIGLVQVGVAAMADRYTYLPLTGIFIILAWGLGGIFSRWRGSQPAIIFLAALIVVLCAWRTRLQVGYWQNGGTLFHHTLAVTKKNYVAYNNLGTWLSSHGQPAVALDCFRESLRIKPDNVDALYNLGNSLAKFDQWDNAEDCYRRALQITPAKADILNNLGLVLVKKKQYDAAVTNFEMVLELKPDSVSTHNNLATVLFLEHRFAESAQHYREALRFMPDSNDPSDTVVKSQIYANLGDALAKQGKTSEAAQSYRQALELQPDNARIKTKLQALGTP